MFNNPDMTINQYSRPVFISHASSDEKAARSRVEGLEHNGIRCWLAPRDVMPGQSWGKSIMDAILGSAAIILIYSSNSDSSMHVTREIETAVSHDIPVIPYRIEDVAPTQSINFFLANSQWFDGSSGNSAEQLENLSLTLRQLNPAAFPANEKQAYSETADREDRSHGYVFISYVRNDTDFVKKLRRVFESKKYGYWDYVVGDRDYHGTLYRELEERIDGAVAFMTVVSDDWRKSDWVASEFIYARESTIPIFVIQAKKLTRSLPILLNLQTRIDMSGDFKSGAETLVQELSKKGL